MNALAAPCRQSSDTPDATRVHLPARRWMLKQVQHDIFPQGGAADPGQA
jgi:hypothetical protein